MSTFTIGRIGVDTASGGDGTTLQHPYEWQQNGRQVALAGLYVAASDADAVQFVENWTRLGDNPDETWVPITCSAVSDLNGYARVLSSSASIGRASLGSGGHRVVDWSCQIERAQASSRPIVEVSDVSTGLTNGKSITTFTNVQSIPPGTLLSAVAGYTASTRSAETGTANIVYYSAMSSTYVAKNQWKAVTPPGDWYKTSANVSTSAGVLTGRRDTVVGTAPFTIGNGLVRVKTAGATFNFSWWNGSAWTSDVGFAVQSHDGTAFAWSGSTVLRNSPEECVVRMTGTNSMTGITTADIAVRRGDLLARIYCTSISTNGHRIAFTSTRAMTATNATGGLRTSSTVSSQYIVFGSGYSTATDTTNGSITSANRATNVLMIGVTSSGGTGGDPGGSAGIAAQMFGVYGNTQRVVFA